MLVDPDFQLDTKIIRRWLHGRTVSSEQLITELRDWADYLEDQAAARVERGDPDG